METRFPDGLTFKGIGSQAKKIYLMLIEYRLTRHRRWKYIFLPLIKLSAASVIVMIGCTIWLDPPKEDLPLIFGFTWLYFFIVHLLPLLIMGIKHNQRSRDSYFSVDTVNASYRFVTKHGIVSFRAADIEKVIKVVSPPKYDNRIDVMGFGYFFY